MIPSLSIVLNVRDIEHKLEKLVFDLLDVVPDLTSRFDILLCDSGSSDDTPELAADLAKRFPQVARFSAAPNCGRGRLLATAMTAAQGDLILLYPEHCQQPVAELAKLWRWSDSSDVVLGVSIPHKTMSLLELGRRLFTRGEDRHLGMLLMRRRAAHWLQDATYEGLDELIDDLDRAKMRYQVVELCETTDPAHLPRRGGPARPKFLQRHSAANWT